MPRAGETDPVLMKLTLRSTMIRSLSTSMPSWTDKTEWADAMGRSAATDAAGEALIRVGRAGTGAGAGQPGAALVLSLGWQPAPPANTEGAMPARCRPPRWR